MKHCCARSAMTWKTVLNRNRNPPTVQRAAAATGTSSSASGTILCPMHCNLPRKKASLRQPSMPNLSASTPTTSPRSAHRGDVVGVEALKFGIEVCRKDAFLRGKLQCIGQSIVPLAEELVPVAAAAL